MLSEILRGNNANATVTFSMILSYIIPNVKHKCVFGCDMPKNNSTLFLFQGSPGRIGPTGKIGLSLSVCNTNLLVITV